MVSQWKQASLLSELSDRFFVLRWKSSGWKRWEHVGERCHTPPCPLGWLLMEGMSQCGSDVVWMEALSEPGPRSRSEERPVF